METHSSKQLCLFFLAGDTKLFSGESFSLSDRVSCDISEPGKRSPQRDPAGYDQNNASKQQDRFWHCNLLPASSAALTSKASVSHSPSSGPLQASSVRLLTRSQNLGKKHNISSLEIQPAVSLAAAQHVGLTIKL